MQVANGRVETVRLDGRPPEIWEISHLLHRIEVLETRNRLLRGKLTQARMQVAELEGQNRHLRDRLLGAVTVQRPTT